MIAVGDRRANDQVVLTRVAVQQDFERREQRHEQGNSFMAAQRL